MSENMYSSMIAATCRTFQDWKHSTKSSSFAFNHPLFFSLLILISSGSVQILLLTHHWLVRPFPSAQSIPVPLRYIQEAEFRCTKKARETKQNQPNEKSQARSCQLSSQPQLGWYICPTGAWLFDNSNLHRFYRWRVWLLPFICLPFSRNILFFEIFRYLFLCCMLSVDWQRRFGQTNSRWGPSYRWKQVFRSIHQEFLSEIAKGS